MSLKDDVKDLKEETKEVKQEHSIAWEIIHDLKVENKTIKILLGLSIITNVVIAILLK